MPKLSRVELYELVWSKPMTEIAREFGIRDQHIARACDLFDISRPPAGHWQKIQHGKAVEKSPLDNYTFHPDDAVVLGSMIGSTRDLSC